MGYKCSFTAISPRIPREDIWGQPEGGPDAATAAVREFFGDAYAYDRAGSSDETYPSDEGIWVATWGDTVLFSADPVLLEGARWELQDGMGRWDLNIHSVVDLCQFEVTGGPFGGRSVALYADMETTFEEACSGRPLPFEKPYLAGEHGESLGEGDPQPAISFHPLELGNSAVLWMFGILGETPPPDAVTGPLLEQRPDYWEVPMHRLEPVPDKPKKRWFGLRR
ncbi:hypothetical protein CGZ93_05725 [Enemella dayhoffiae]|uniref:Uncharacterized protein n=1 Tax=Enemella dayhoffiae TaxID=2016507 RepID=A0A255H8F0_9ACTN|nr:hypothetical protein [Enemella dayhoffiae]OYO23443.1 hypothetical protein CGZ93_05725 [Enemella dayhoffiae]